MGPMSRPLTRSGQWSQTTTGISQPAARLTEQNLRKQKLQGLRPRLGVGLRSMIQFFTVRFLISLFGSGC